MPKELIDLTGNWEFKEYPSHARRMRDLDATGWMPTQIPSSIYTSLIDAGQIDRTELNTNPEDFIYISQKPWIFRKTFDTPQKLLDCSRADLIFEGLDTVSQIWLNDKLIAKTDNMFIPHRFDITSLLKPKNNRLLIKFDSAIDYAEKLMQRYGKLTEFYFGYPCRSYIRKAQYQFGWDWCPPLPGCGIFRPVRLEGIASARIEDLHIRTIDCNDKYADLSIAMKLQTEPSSYPLTCKLKITNGVQLEQALDFQPGHNRQSTIIRIENPNLWWPNGSGTQHLYNLNVELISNDKTIDRITKSFGIRTAQLNRSKDKHGESFQFEINHQTVYAKGANWIPLTIFPGSQKRSDYEQLLKSAADANINMLRVWGGGYYENPEFYDLCDRLGIMVWQDFMFACSYYPDRQWFLDNVKTEATAVIKRLRNHPSIVLWCGNNEIDWLHTTGVLGKGRKFYGRAIYRDILPKLLAELDNNRDYIPTTPLSKSGHPNKSDSGTIHQWQVWSGGEPARNYITPKESIPRFVTEFGFQSLPEINTIKTFCPDDQLRIASHTLEKHNYQLDGNSRLARYLTDIFAPPKNLEDYAYLTQLTQAREIKRYVEHLRTHNQINKGVLFWQFNDCCPALSWSAIDSNAKPKALYYYAKRFFAPSLITLLAPSTSTRPDINPSFASAKIIIINDSPNPITATLRCRLMDLNANTLDHADFPVAMAPGTHSASLKLPKAIANPKEPNKSLLNLTLQDHEEIIAENTFTCLPDKYMDWQKPKIDAQLAQIDNKKWELTLNSETIVRDLQITTQKDAALSDNFFDIIPNTDRRIIIEFQQQTPKPKKLIQFKSVESTL